MQEIKKVIVFSRHGLRYPTDIIEGINPVVSALLHFRRGRLCHYGKKSEYYKGKWFAAFLRNYGLQFDNKDIRCYSTTNVRTIESAQYFLKGFLPDALIDVRTEIDDVPMNRVFGSLLHFENEEEKKTLEKELNNDSAYQRQYRKDRDVLKKCLGEITNLEILSQQCDTITLEENEGPRITGDLHTAATLADSLIHLHLICPHYLRRTTKSEWQSLSRICDQHRIRLFGNPIITKIAAKPMIDMLDKTLISAEQKISYFCCHDSNLFCLMNALHIKEYQSSPSDFGCLPSGCMIVFFVVKNDDGDEKMMIHMYTPRDEDILNHNLFSLSKPPICTELISTELNMDDNNCIALDDFINLLKNSRS